MSGGRRARCPTCRKSVENDAGEFPFCSERSRLVYLHKWLTGPYRIPTVVQAEDADDE